MVCRFSPLRCVSTEQAAAEATALAENQQQQDSRKETADVSEPGYAVRRSGAAGSLVLSGAGDRTFTFTKLQVPAEDPTVAGRGEIPLVLNMTCRGDGASDEFTVS